MIKIGTYNLFEFGSASDDAAGRRPDIIEAIRDLDVDVLAVQEIDGEGTGREAIMNRLAEDTGLRCRIGGVYALAVSGYRFATGVLWHPRVQPTEVVWPGQGAFRHRVAGIIVHVGGIRTMVGSFHADAARTHQRIDDAASLAMCATRGPWQAAVIGGDFNDTATLDPDWTGTPNTSYIYETQWDVRDGVVHHWPDRRAAHTLELGGLFDTAALVDPPVQPTAGHWPGDWSTNRRKDRIYVTEPLRPVVRALTVVDTPTTVRASDHLPAVVHLDQEQSGGADGS